MVASSRAGVLVLGSLNVDSTAYVDRLPAPGETVTSLDDAVALGGKGTNQAVAAARAGAEVRLIARVGDDPAGSFAVEELERLGLSVAGVAIGSGRQTGAARITVDSRGENTVVVSPGANASMDQAVVADHAEEFGDVSVALAQGEIPIAAIDALAEACQDAGCRLVVNLAPVVSVSASTLALCDPLVVNEHEAAELGVVPAGDGATAWRAAVTAAVGRGLARTMVVTLGSAGAVGADAGGDWAVKAPKVDAVDATGAGDCFTGTLAACLAGGMELRLSAERGVIAAALSVTARGTVDSYADREAVIDWMRERGIA